MNRQDIEYTNDRTGSDLLSSYIEKELHPIDMSGEADYLAEKCGVSAGDAAEFISARDLLYTANDSDAEFILSDICSGIESGMFFGSGTETDPDSFFSLLYYSGLYRIDSGKEKEQFRRYFPTVSSLEEIYRTESRSVCDD